MRSAALVFGLLATGLGVLAVAYGNLQTGLMVASALGGDALLAKGILYATLLVGLLGAIMALFWPRVGSILLLLSAIAWAAAAFLAGHGAVLFAAAPFTFAGAAGLVALFARRRETTVTDEDDGDWDDEEEEDDHPAYAPAPRGLRGREPAFAPEPPPPPARRQPPPPPVVADEPSEDEAEEDYIDADEAVAEPEDGEYGEYEEADASADDEAAAEEVQHDEEDDDEGEARPEGNWQLPDPRQSPPPRSARQRYIPAAAPPPPARRQPARRSPPPRREESFDIEDGDFAPPARREFEPRPRNGYREFAPYDPKQRRAGGAARGLVRLLLLLIFVVVVAGLGVWVYADYERGPDSILFGSRGGTTRSDVTSDVANRPAAVTAPAPAPARAPATPRAEAAATPAPAETQVPLDNTAPPAASAAGQGTTQLAPLAAAPGVPAPATPPAAASAAIPQTFSDPFAYCHAVDTADTPDSQYSGPALPDAVRAAAQGAAVDQIHWRCANKDVLVCNANHGAACDLTPTVDTMLSYCASHPGTTNIPAPNGSWSCNGKRPVIPRDQKWPVDARGFYPGAWARVAPPSAG